MRKKRPLPAAATEIQELAADIRELVADWRRAGEIEVTTFLGVIKIKLPKEESDADN
jgi:signal transduction histidine kinase